MKGWLFLERFLLPKEAYCDSPSLSLGNSGVTGEAWENGKCRNKITVAFSLKKKEASLVKKKVLKCLFLFLQNEPTIFKINIISEYSVRKLESKLLFYDKKKISYSYYLGKKLQSLRD